MMTAPVSGADDVCMSVSAQAFECGLAHPTPLPFSSLRLIGAKVAKFANKNSGHDFCFSLYNVKSGLEAIDLHAPIFTASTHMQLAEEEIVQAQAAREIQAR